MRALCIDVGDPKLWSETRHVRALLRRFGIRATAGETPFRAWRALPDLALLAIKWHREKDKPCWHWVVFVRDGGRACVLDPKKSLRTNVRTDFGRIRPKWFIGIL